MNKLHRRTLRSTAAALGALLLLAPAAAQAGTETLIRSVSNVVLGPVEVLMAPWLAGQNLYNNLNSIDDTTAVRVVYAVPGYFWLTTVQGGASLLRTATGFIEFLPGLVVLPLDAELDPLFDPVERGEAMIDIENDWVPIRLGINYTTPPF
ncbi:MAG: hypothetical protein MJE66_19575 [Proteobacteria bacterium]|nr:hypothetical protein [Pseudomonadota bacterium]